MDTSPTVYAKPEILVTFSIEGLLGTAVGFGSTTPIAG
jgi:hypothetical protein